MCHRPTSTAKPVAVLSVHFRGVHLHLAEKELQHVCRFLKQIVFLLAKPHNNWMHRSGINAFIFAHGFSFAAR
jgi:hypothetical protein